MDNETIVKSQQNFTPVCEYNEYKVIQQTPTENI